VSRQVHAAPGWLQTRGWLGPLGLVCHQHVHGPAADGRGWYKSYYSCSGQLVWLQTWELPELLVLECH
jgi:hypothetical protein